MTDLKEMKATDERKDVAFVPSELSVICADWNYLDNSVTEVLLLEKLSLEVLSCVKLLQQWSFVLQRDCRLLGKGNANLKKPASGKQASGVVNIPEQ